MLQELMDAATDAQTKERAPGQGAVEQPQCSSARIKFDVRVARNEIQFCAR